MSEVSPYYSNVNEDLLKSIPPDCRRVLEVGCGTGALASRYKLVNPRCEYVGVEYSFKAAEIARKESGIDEVMCCDFENEKYWDCFEWFDCIVFGDVLEHLKEPAKTVERCSRHHLNEGGSIVACIPNIAHWSAIQTLLNGQWPQMDSGLFDATHLRFFTRDSIKEMFESAGLVVDKIVARKIFPGGERLIKAVREHELVADPDRFAEDSQAYQYVVHAVNGVVPSRKVLIRGFTAEACCARPRLTEPGTFLNTIPGFRYSEVPTQVEPGESVVVVRQRFNITEEAVRTHLKNGCLIVGEWDDDPWYEGFHDKLKVPSVEWALKACHAITVSTEAIAELVRPINPNVAVFPNQIAAVGPKREYVESDVVRVYMGGQRRREDWEEAVKVVNEIVAQNPDRYDFVVVHDRDLYEALETKHKTFYAFQPYEKYRALLRTCDVSISTLADTRFNRCKSDITAIECWAESVFWTNFPRDLSCSVSDILITRSANRDCLIEDRMLCDHYRKRADQFNAWLDAKPELDRQLFERLPELKEGS